MACPTDTYAEDTGATALILCQKCQDKSSTQGLIGQNSSRACACDKEYYLVTSLQKLQTKCCHVRSVPRGQSVATASAHCAMLM